ncbi:hypothetical protein [Pyxidicoccus caerfyrddinensis]|uniref:hypothetical protein n=1 Tax=Pyxidicoccus caerfyrddinensis TaxID=2709663 RepID=UPI0013D968B7|nr:hypothetical protein [Pyxidicoccus caerfyrddinensis]
MNWQHAVSLAFAAFVLNGCGGGEEEAKTRSGIYEFEMVREYDTCTPKRAVGHIGQVNIIEDTDSFWVFYVLAGEDAPVRGVHGAKVMKDAPVETERVAVSDCPETRRWMSLELLSDLDPLEVRYKERYSNMAGCELDPDITYAGIPDSDCEASILLRYSLVQYCSAPCTTRDIVNMEDGTNTIVCECK